MTLERTREGSCFGKVTWRGGCLRAQHRGGGTWRDGWAARRGPLSEGLQCSQSLRQAGLASPPVESSDQIIVNDSMLATWGSTCMVPPGETCADAAVLPILQLRKQRPGRLGFCPEQAARSGFALSALAALRPHGSPPPAAPSQGASPNCTSLGSLALDRGRGDGLLFPSYPQTLLLRTASRIHLPLARPARALRDLLRHP